jgi:hypothetical protein
MRSEWLLLILETFSAGATCRLRPSSAALNPLRGEAHRSLATAAPPGGRIAGLCNRHRQACKCRTTGVRARLSEPLWAADHQGIHARLRDDSWAHGAATGAGAVVAKIAVAMSSLPRITAGRRPRNSCSWSLCQKITDSTANRFCLGWAGHSPSRRHLAGGGRAAPDSEPGDYLPGPPASPERRPRLR